jgi:hypothetical protein
MSTVRLSNREHYFNPPAGYPYHPFLSGLSHDRFKFIWYQSSL